MSTSGTRIGPHAAALCLWLWLSCAAAQPAQPAAAAPCEVPSADEAVPNYTGRAVSLRRCLGNTDRDKHALTQSFVGSLEKPVAVTHTQGVEAALDLLLTEIALQSKEGFDQALWTALATELSFVRARAAQLAQVADAGAWRKASEDLVPSKWNAPQGVIELAGTEFDVLAAPTACENAKPCSAFASRVAAIRVINLVRRLDVHLESPFTLQHFAAGRVRLQRWEAYRKDAHPLYWWEVFVNGALMDGPLLGAGGKAPCEKDGSGTSIGFCDVPTRQLILLHPEPAVRFSRTATKSSELKPALVVELIGWYRWDWAGETSAEMRGRRGLSLAATYTSTEREAELGYGPMFHWNDFSLAVTKASRGRWSLVISVPLAGEYYGRKQQIVDELSKVKKSSLSELLLK
ncbi:hypothetical protein HLB44_27250 [Aquincola sp. S2]|uniref:DUF1311 domain-containing protein n=1 Tax=Pseudaquabacterium terrae TaxID=2732868 RepID=A0ABX2EQ34_9BURK|nr:hypothetical protein [Aquabacterium terrae]NRF70708.1 hypothetical protein [Aquabacterium terrae]